MSSRKKTVAALLPRGSEYTHRIMEGIADYIEQERSLQMTDKCFFAESGPDLGAIADFDAAIVWPRASDKWIQRLLKLRLPIISLSTEWTSPLISCLAYSSRSYHEMVLDHLQRLGCREVAYVCRDTGHSACKLKTASCFVESAHQRGLPARNFCIGEFPDIIFDRDIVFDAEIEAGLRDFLRGLDHPAGIYCASDYIGAELCRVANAIGLQIPDQLAVIGRFDYRIARCCTPPLSSVPLGIGIGFKAMQMLDRRLNSGVELPRETIVPPPPISWRESTGGGTAAIGYIRRAQQIIHTQACNSITVAEVAETVSVAPQTLHKHFMRAFGHSPGHAIRHERLEHAKHYLARTESSIAEVAGMCGYSQQSKFTNFFKRQTGITPSQYRRKFKA